MKFTVALSSEEDLAALHDIEARAARLVGDHPVTKHLDLTDETPRDFHAAHSASLLWVAHDDLATPIGFALVEDLGDAWHLEEMDVDPAHARKGVGTALVRAVCEAAALRGPKRVTLCTFRDVPWNAPFYARLGFTPLEDAALLPTLRERIADEEARGLPKSLRITMLWEGI